MKNILKDILKSPQLSEGSAWTQKNYQMNEIVVKEGDQGDSLFFIEKGELRVSRRVDLDNNKHIQPGVGDLKAGTIFGESCLHVSLPRIATVTAITPVQLLKINGESLGIYLDAHPVEGYLFYKKLSEVVITRLNNSNQTVESLIAWGLKAHEIDQHL